MKDVWWRFRENFPTLHLFIMAIGVPFVLGSLASWAIYQMRGQESLTHWSGMILVACLVWVLVVVNENRQSNRG